MHEPGQCPEPLYGTDCDGMGVFAPDPFQEDVHGDSTPVWECEGVRRGSAMDI